MLHATGDWAQWHRTAITVIIRVTIYLSDPGLNPDYQYNRRVSYPLNHLERYKYLWIFPQTISVCWLGMNITCGTIHFRFTSRPAKAGPLVPTEQRQILTRWLLKHHTMGHHFCTWRVWRDFGCTSFPSSFMVRTDPYILMYLGRISSSVAWVFNKRTHWLLHKT